MKWLANASKTDAKIIMLFYPDLEIGTPVPKKQEKELMAEGLVGIYGNYPSVGKRATESDE